MSWYNEKEHGGSKAFLEWAFKKELVPDEEPLFYKEKEIENDE